MAKFGFLGSILGAAVGLAFAPATGGASLLWAAGGSLAGGAAGSQLDASRAASQGNRIAKEQSARNKEYQNTLRSERAKTDATLARERTRVEAGIARSLKRKYRVGGTGFLNTEDPTTGVLG